MRSIVFAGLLMALGACGGDDKADTDGIDTDTDTPAAAEDCFDGFDNDGNGATDCDDPACDTTCDADGDGFVSIAQGGDDCDDGNPDVYPGATEVCDGVDNNCDGLADDDDPAVDASASVWYADADQDGYGNPGQGVRELRGAHG